MSHELDNRRSSYEGTLTKQRDPLAIKAADPEKGLLDGYASKWWVVDSYAEATAPGAFLQTIADRGPAGANRILLRYEHQVTIGTHTKMGEDTTGLLIEAHVSDDQMDGTRVRRHLADGVQYGLSIGFRRYTDRSAEDSDPLDFSSAPDWVKTLPRNEIRILTGLKLFENSVVSFPAVDPALITNYRSEPPDIEALFAAVKSGRLTAEQTAHLKALLDAQPADTGTTDGEMPAARADQTELRRNYAAEFELLLNRSAIPGVNL